MGTWIVPATVQAVSVTPSTGSGTTQTFSFQIADSAGASDLTSVSVMFNSTLNAVSGCEVDYYRTVNIMKLLTDSGGQPSGSLTPGSGSAQNSQCILNGAASSVSTSGNTLTLTLALTFEAAFGGVKNIYVEALSPSGTAPWQVMGTWTVSAAGQSAFRDFEGPGRFGPNLQLSVHPVAPAPLRIARCKPKRSWSSMKLGFLSARRSWPSGDNLPLRLLP
jgi:hypothetical protein